MRVGCAGWSLPRAVQPGFGDGPSHLARYATRLSAAEINSSFHREHQRGVYERWGAAVPAGFRFSVKLPRAISHDQRLADCEALLDRFLPQARGLGERLGCLLVQLPPSLAFDATVADAFLAALRRRHGARVAMEPRHASWFAADADALLRAHGVARVLADPVRHEAGRWPGGCTDWIYLRLHGSPRMYYSPYAPALLQALAARITLAREEGRGVWCIFDNTASGAAASDALALAQHLSDVGR